MSNTKLISIISLFSLFFIYCSGGQPVVQGNQAVQDNNKNIDSKNVSQNKNMGTWIATIGGRDDDWAEAVVASKDGGFVVVGPTRSFGAGLADVMVIKLTNDATIEWQKTFGGQEGDFANGMTQTSDGGYVISGWTGSFGAGRDDLWLIKVDANGNLQWQKTYGGPEDDHANNVIQTRDGNLVAVGWTASFVTGTKQCVSRPCADLWVLKVDLQGNVLWQKHYGGNEVDSGSAIIETADGAVVIAGDTDSFGPVGIADTWVVKLDSSNGNIIWQKTYGGVDEDLGNALVETSDGSIVVTSETKSFGNGSDSDISVVKLTSQGNIVWQKRIAGSMNEISAFNLIKDNDGIIVTGGTESFGIDFNAPGPMGPNDINDNLFDLLVMKLDSNGNMVWQNFYGSRDDDFANSAGILNNGNIVVVGKTLSFGSGNPDILVALLDSNGAVTGGCNLSSHPSVRIIDTNFALSNSSISPVDTTAVVQDVQSFIKTPFPTIYTICPR